MLDCIYIIHLDARIIRNRKILSDLRRGLSKQLTYHKIIQSKYKNRFDLILPEYWCG